VERGQRDPYDPVEVLVNEWRVGRGPRGTSRWTASHPASAVVVATVLMLLIPTVPAFLAFRAGSWPVLVGIVVAAVGLAVVTARANRRNVDITRRAVERFDAERHGSR
jgi:hypothetical protein